MPEGTLADACVQRYQTRVRAPHIQRLHLEEIPTKSADIFHQQVFNIVTYSLSHHFARVKWVQAVCERSVTEVNCSAIMSPHEEQVDVDNRAGRELGASSLDLRSNNLSEPQ